MSSPLACLVIGQSEILQMLPKVKRTVNSHSLQGAAFTYTSLLSCLEHPVVCCAADDWFICMSCVGRNCSAAKGNCYRSTCSNYAFVVLLLSNADFSCCDAGLLQHTGLVYQRQAMN